MSVKRQATTDLNHDNWDQEDPSEQKEMGQFKAASKDVLEKRVIRTAKRRTRVSDEPTTSVFSGFGGFNKAPPSSFDFLANLTNGTKNSNGTSNKESSGPSSLFSNKPMNPGGGLFGFPASTTPSSTMSATLSPTSAFGTAAKTSPSSLFTAPKADSTVNEMPSKTQTVSSSDENKPVVSSVFGVSSTSADKSLFSSTNSTPFKIQPASSTTAMVQTSFDITTKPAQGSNSPEKKDEDKANEKKMKYYSKLKGLNESVSDWISKHVAQTPLCILSPIFKDYEKYLKDITEEYQDVEKEESDKNTETITTETKVSNVSIRSVATPIGTNNVKSFFNSSSINTPSKPSIFGTQNDAGSPNDKPTFSFGIKALPNKSVSATTTSTAFSFGVLTSSTTSPTSSSISLNTNASTNQSSTAPFSFGTGKPFSFSSNTVKQTSVAPTAPENEEYVPPKVEYTPVQEENSVYETKCKIFVKNDNNFADKGVGTLYVKKIEESGKHQLLVRANTSLGTILLNLVLVSAIPTQRMGKNNVMLICIPTPEAQPPPTTVLIRVKTGEEADELLEMLNKYKA